MLTAATLAGWSWAAALRAGAPFRRRESALFLVWAVLAGVSRMLDLRADGLARTTADVLGLIGSGLALVAAVGVVRRVTVAIGVLGAAVAEAALNATSLVTLAWILAGGPLSPPFGAVAGAAPALVDLAAAALVVRLAT